ncbi:MAG: hypothetical protein AB2421_19650 [Thermotaleaceae bacterium]
MNSKKIQLFALGFGIGLLFSSSIVMFFGYNTPRQVTPDYIRMEARRLGMIDPKEYFDKSETKPNEEFDEALEESLKEEHLQGESLITITIRKGNTSEDVARLLKASDLIDSEQKFIKKVYEKNAAYSIQTGTYQFKKGITEDEIIHIILKGN